MFVYIPNNFLLKGILIRLVNVCRQIWWSLIWLGLRRGFPAGHKEIIIPVLLLLLLLSLLLLGADIWRGRLWDGAKRRKLVKEGNKDGSEVLREKCIRLCAEEEKHRGCLADLTLNQTLQFSLEDCFIQHVLAFLFVNYDVSSFWTDRDKTCCLTLRIFFCSSICGSLTIISIMPHFYYLPGCNLVFLNQKYFLGWYFLHFVGSSFIFWWFSYFSLLTSFMLLFLVYICFEQLKSWLQVFWKGFLSASFLFCRPTCYNVECVLLLASSVWRLWMSAAAGAERRFWQQRSPATHADPQRPQQCR